MKLKALAFPAWIEDERLLLHYLISPHAGHPYAEDLLDAVSLITSWVLIIVSILAVLGVIAEAVLR